MRRVYLTTTDNPYNPHTQFDEWKAFDELQGYNSCAYLARIVKSSDDLSPLDQAIAVEEAIDEIVALNILGIYKKIVVDDEKTA